MGFFVIGDIDTNHIIQTIKNNFEPFNNSKELEFPNYKIPDYPNNQFFVYQDDEQESISFSIFEKGENGSVSGPSLLLGNLRTDVFLLTRKRAACNQRHGTYLPLGPSFRK